MEVHSFFLDLNLQAQLRYTAEMLDMTAVKPEATVIVITTAASLRGSQQRYTLFWYIIVDIGLCPITVYVDTQIVAVFYGTLFEHLAMMRKTLDARKKDVHYTI